ncbi:MAG TPA: hypothetical protein VGS05_01300 [Candidatus Sulfotelmatobacter sp.]|nr:hypothetical protein [Candidatus Sulfotelmatobacter sp.]
MGALAGVVGAVALEFAFAGFGLLDVALFDPALEVDPLCAVFPAAGMHATPPELAGVVGRVPCGAGRAVVGMFCGFVPCVGD